MLEAMLLNTIKSLVVSKAQNLVTDHVERLDDKSASLSQVMVGALTVVLSQIGQYMWGSDKSDTEKEITIKQEESNAGSNAVEYD